MCSGGRGGAPAYLAWGLSLLETGAAAEAEEVLATGRALLSTAAPAPATALPPLPAATELALALARAQLQQHKAAAAVATVRHLAEYPWSAHAALAPPSGS